MNKNTIFLVLFVLFALTNSQGFSPFSMDFANINSVNSLRRMPDTFDMPFAAQPNFSFNTANNIDIQQSNQNESLPTAIEIEKLINQNKISDISSLIQKVKKSMIKCDVKTAYLNDLVGKIQLGFELKRNSAYNQRILIENSKNKIQRLRNDNVAFKAQQTDLNIAVSKRHYQTLSIELKNTQYSYKSCNIQAQNDQLNYLRASLNDYEKRIQDSNSIKTFNSNQIRKIDVEIQQLQIQLTRLIKIIQDNSNSLLTVSQDVNNEFVQQTDLTQINQNIQIEKINQEIKRLDDQLMVVKSNKKTREINVINLQKNIEQLQTKTIEIKNLISSVSKVIKNYSKCNNLKTAIDEINVSVKNLKQKIRVDQLTFNTLSSKINSTNNQITKLNPNIVNSEERVKSDLQGIESISLNIQNFKQSAIESFYMCYGVINMQFMNSKNEEPLVRLGRMSLTSYLKKMYNHNNMTQSEITVAPMDIFSQSFQQEYGFGLASQVQNSAKSDNPSLTLDGDFSCHETINNVISKKGTIRGINGRSIDVLGDDGTYYQLNLGSCSRFESIGTSTLPKIENRIVWKGASSGDKYLVHSATFY